jgi:predicted naringenin-chalcone synthase
MQAVAQMQRQLGLRVDFRRLTFESLGQIAASAGESRADSGPQTIPKKGMLGRLMGTLRARAGTE